MEWRKQGEPGPVKAKSRLSAGQSKNEFDKLGGYYNTKYNEENLQVGTYRFPKDLTINDFSGTGHKVFEYFYNNAYTQNDITQTAFSIPKTIAGPSKYDVDKVYDIDKFIEKIQELLLDPNVSELSSYSEEEDLSVIPQQNSKKIVRLGADKMRKKKMKRENLVAAAIEPAEVVLSSTLSPLSKEEDIKWHHRPISQQFFPRSQPKADGIPNY
uniref:Uncharacterized protein n=1 Tax=Rhodnius prolixus TaxID=13249 RepID=T1HU41_RHOPR